MGSASELDYHLLLAHDLDYLAADAYQQYSNDIVELKKMLASLINKIKTEC
jgi:four helix bundle protein